MVTHVPVPLVLLSNKQVDLFKSNPDAAPIDFLNAARLDFQIHLFQTIRESGLISYFQTVSVVFNPTTRSFTMSVIILILCMMLNINLIFLNHICHLNFDPATKIFHFQHKKPLIFFPPARAVTVNLQKKVKKTEKGSFYLFTSGSSAL